MKADPDEDDTFLFVKSEFSVTYQAVEGKKFFVNSFTVKSFHAMIILSMMISLNIEIEGITVIEASFVFGRNPICAGEVESV